MQEKSPFAYQFLYHTEYVGKLLLANTQNLQIN